MLDFSNLTVKYKNSETLAVSDVSFSLNDGEFVGVVGESGSGKTSVISAAMGLLPVGATVTGSIYFKGRDLLALPPLLLNKIRWNEIALIPQGALNSFTPVLTIGHHIYEVLNRHKKLNKNECESIIPSLLEDVELESSIALRYPHELSGGQKQRAAIALSLACEPSLLFADEPTTALDVVTQSGILRLLVKLQKERNLTIVLVTHDLPMASSVCNSLYVMKGGCMVESGKSSDVIHSPREDYTKSLVKAMLFR